MSLIAFLGLNAVAGVVLLTEGRDLLPTLFETTSAFGTVGLSMGENGSVVSLSAFFTPIGKILMMRHDVHGPGRSAHAGAGARAPRRRCARRSVIPKGKVLIG